MKKALLLVLLVTGFYFANAQTNDQAEIPGFHKHDGFYLSMSVGPIFGKIVDNYSDKTLGSYQMEFSGTGAQFDFKIGAAIQENLILHATLISSSLQGPKITVSNKSVKAPDELSVGEAMIGAGITYYTMPYNLFFSGSVGIGNFSLIDSKNNDTASTERGFSMQLKAGKEWWISKNWGLGAGITYTKTALTSKPSSGVEEKFDSSRFAIVFTATFN